MNGLFSVVENTAVLYAADRCELLRKSPTVASIREINKLSAIRASNKCKKTLTQQVNLVSHRSLNLNRDHFIMTDEQKTFSLMVKRTKMLRPVTAPAKHSPS